MCSSRSEEESGSQFRLQSAANSPFSGLLLGAVFFLSVFGVHLLDPTKTDWLMVGDRAQHYLGWEFFRHEPWRFPLGRIAGFGTPDGTSVVFTDSIPLMAIPLKALRWLLPQPFQFEGLWIITCYCLQGLFGWLLSALTTKRMGARALMTCFFLLSPALMFRFNEGHHALMAHWTILAALYLALQPVEVFRLRHPRLPWLAAWCLLLSVTGLIHLYLCVMVLVIYGGAVVTYLASGAGRPWHRQTLLALPPSMMGLGMYLDGSFVVSSSNWALPYISDFTLYSMNLLAPIRPLYDGKPEDAQFVSYFLSPAKMAMGGQHEGFNYMGVGAWLLVGLLLLAVIWFLATSRLHIPRPPVPVILGVFALGVVALSYQVTIGPKILYRMQVGPNIARWCEVFRSTGRFFWPASYLVLWLTFLAWGRLERRKPDVFMGLLSLAFTLQVLDLSQFFYHYARMIDPQAIYKTPLQSSFWGQALRQYENIAYYPQTDNHLYIPLALLAAPRGIGINVAYKARYNQGVLEQSNLQIKAELETAKLQNRTLYVFQDQALFEQLTKHLGGTHSLLRKVDGYNVAGLLPVP